MRYKSSPSPAYLGKYIYETSLHSPLLGSGFDIHHQLLWSICVHMLAMGRRQMCYNFFYALIFANAVYNDGCFSLPDCVWSGGSSLQHHTRDASCRLEPKHPFPGQPWPGTCGGTVYINICMSVYIDIYCSAKGRPPGDSGSSADALQMVLNPDLWKLWMTFSKQYFEKYGWGWRLKIKEQASVHPLIYICSTWKGTVCYVDKNRQLLRGSVQLVSWAGSVVFVVELIHRQHQLQWDGFHAECQLLLQKFWHSVWS